MYLHILISNCTWTLATFAQTRKTMNNYSQTTKSLQKPMKIEFHIIFESQQFIVLLGFYSGLEFLTMKTIVKKKKTTNFEVS